MSILQHRLLRELACCLALLSRISFALQVTYPTQNAVYSAAGPWDIQWLEQQGDPSEVTIYMNTYTNNKISNYLKCLNWTTDSGSVYITTSQGAPRGDYWTWMFYDASAPIQLSTNHIAESAHFIVNGSTLSSSDHASSSGKKGLPAGAAAGIAVVVMLLVLALCGTAAFFLWYRPHQRKRSLDAPAAGSVEELCKPELGDNPGTSNSASTAPPRPQMQAPGQSPGPESPTTREFEMESGVNRTPVVRRSELSAPTRLYEMDRENTHSSHQFWELPDTRPGASQSTAFPNELPSSARSPVPTDRSSEAQNQAKSPNEHIIEQAQALDSIPEAERGPLHGIAVGIEDIMDTKGLPSHGVQQCNDLSAVDMPTRFGSALYEDNKPNTDAAPVSILRDAGAIIFGLVALSYIGNVLILSVGKPTTTEFTVLNEGPDTTNPADRQRTPGGSAAGSAAAVADFQVPLSLGTQSGGSVIRPASYTGIFAMKPTHNAMSTEGIKVVSWDIDTCGFFARTVEDLELIANIFALERDKNKLEPVPLSAIRVAFVETPFFDQAGNGTRAAMSRAGEILKEASVKSVEKVELPFENDNAKTLNRIHKTVFGYEAKNAFLVDVRHDKQHELDPKIRKYVDEPKYSNVEMVEAMEAYEHMRTDFDKFAHQYDAFITPSAVDIAPEGLDDMGASIFNFLWTGLQTPVVHVPAFTGEHGMPVGLSIISGRYNDERLLQVVDVLSKPLMAKGGWKIEQPKATQKHNVQLPNSHVSASNVLSSQQQRLEDEKPMDSP
ncbi:hypothetical protein H2200_000854 [Cladophialophora chaetospira]|uniref:Amidase domain-containing protein n=1 Tax=Cladophialophora chaetospira TaxID=386627 RepID=A0AA38XP98_9EURO|nr:hypothetical protein H2200_000854 [Cladophialophora chaetospira]